MAQSIDEMGDWLNENVADLSKFDVQVDKELVPQPKFGVDEADSPKSTTGNLIEDIAQFLTGFGVAGKALKGVSAASKVGKAAKFTAQSGIADVLAFDEQEQRISNVVQDTPLANPVTETLGS